ncbi:MAG: YjgP/YjgQ family permease [Nitrospirae bacterium]|nr:YjgP/YjgQ family permease [Nitrospirota bacterium]
MVIYRYITRELGLTFMVCIIGLNMVLMMEKVLRLSRLMSGVGASYLDMTWVLILIQPQLLVLTIPMALLLSVLLTYGRMEVDNELTVLRSSGMRFSEIARPVFYLSAILLAFSVFITLYLMPLSSKTLRGEINRVLKERAPMSIEPGVFFTTFKGFLILINEKTEGGVFRGIFISDSRNPSSERVIVAREGRLSLNKEMQPGFSLTDGLVHIVNRDTSTEIRFAEYKFTIRLSGEGLNRKKSEMTLPELYKRATTEKTNSGGYFIEFHRRLSFPALVIALAFLAPALSLRAGKTGKTGGFIIGLLVFTIYYVALLYFENLVRAGELPHPACWIPFVMLTAVAVLLYRREE